VTIVAIALVTSFNDWTKEKQFRGLQAKVDCDQKITVLRDGALHEIAVKNIVVGDVCQIFYGHLVPADGLVIESNDLRIDESNLTGETELIRKEKNTPMLFSGNL
jgi:P-type E1-E2 ATPase